MKKKDFALGILCGAMLFSGATATAAGITAEPTWQKIYVDGEQVSMTAYNIAGNNYVRLRDIGQHPGEPELELIDAMQSLTTTKDTYLSAKQIYEQLLKRCPASSHNWTSESGKENDFSLVEISLNKLIEYKIVERNSAHSDQYRFLLELYRRYFRTKNDTAFDRTPDPQEYFRLSP